MIVEQQELIDVLRVMPDLTSKAVMLARVTKRSILNVATDLRQLHSQGLLDRLDGGAYRLMEQRHLWE